MIADGDLERITQRVRRAGSANCWTGTAGTIAADALRLVRHIQELAMKPAVDSTDNRDADGKTSKFGTGAVRSDTVEAFRYDLVSPIGLREVARTCAEGAAKYGDWNWEKGMPAHDLLNHALAHIYQFLAGDRSEPHLPHAAWNLMAAIHSVELWPHLNDGTLRGPDCKAPSQESESVTLNSKPPGTAA